MSARWLVLLALTGCGNACERLCRETSQRLAGCLDASTTWPDLGARGRADFAEQCREGWDRTSADLTTSDLGEAVQICDEGLDTLVGLSCDELRVLYAR